MFTYFRLQSVFRLNNALISRKTRLITRRFSLLVTYIRP